MPELPEVETLRRELQKQIKGKTIKSAEVDWPKMVKPLSVKEFQLKIKNKKIIAVKRRAKVLVLDLAGSLSLLIHSKLTGQLIYQKNKKTRKSRCPLCGIGIPTSSIQLHSGRTSGQEINSMVGGHPQKGGLGDLPNKFTHGIINFTDGSVLYFNDLRKFGWMRLVGKLEVGKLQREFGIEPLTKDFKLKNFAGILKKYPNRKIKQILMDQKLIAGIGNIYADESCFCAKIKPIRIAKILKEGEIKNLFNCISKILKFAIAKKGTSADTYVQLSGQPGGMEPYLKVYGRKEEKCKRCGGIVSKIKLNGRGTHFCQRCQR